MSGPLFQWLADSCPGLSFFLLLHRSARLVIRWSSSTSAIWLEKSCPRRGSSKSLRSTTSQMDRMTRAKCTHGQGFFRMLFRLLTLMKKVSMRMHLYRHVSAQRYIPPTPYSTTTQSSSRSCEGRNDSPQVRRRGRDTFSLFLPFPGGFVFFCLVVSSSSFNRSSSLDAARRRSLFRPHRYTFLCAHEKFPTTEVLIVLFSSLLRPSCGPHTSAAQMQDCQAQLSALHLLLSGFLFLFQVIGICLSARAQVCLRLPPFLCFNSREVCEWRGLSSGLVFDHFRTTPRS